MVSIPFLEGKTYLDGGATQPLTTNVIELLDKLNRENVINLSYEYDQAAYEMMEDSLETIGAFFGRSGEDIVFGKSTTELINNVARQAPYFLQDDYEIVISNEEHNANWLPWFEEMDLAFKGHRVKIMEFDKITDYVKSNNVGLVSVAHTTNVVGQTRDIAKICENVSPETLVIIDGCQHAPHVHKLDIPERVNMYVFSGHKIHAPKGIACAYIDPTLQSLLRPFEYGGGNIDLVLDSGEVVFQLGAARFHAGTRDINSIHALAQAIRDKDEMDFTSCYKKRKVLISLLADLPIEMYNRDVDSNTLLFNFLEVDALDAINGTVDNDYGFVSAGVHLRYGAMCNLLTMNKYGISGCFRISISHYNTYNDILEVVDVIENIIKINGGNYVV